MQSENIIQLRAHGRSGWLNVLNHICEQTGIHMWGQLSDYIVNDKHYSQWTMEFNQRVKNTHEEVEICARELYTIQTRYYNPEKNETGEMVFAAYLNHLTIYRDIYFDFERKRFIFKIKNA